MLAIFSVALTLTSQIFDINEFVNNLDIFVMDGGISQLIKKSRKLLTKIQRRFMVVNQFSSFQFNSINFPLQVKVH